MPLKITARATEIEPIDRFDGGVGWIAHPAETMRRASHAIATDDGVIALDPVDGPGVDDLIGDLGGLAGVAVLFDHHARDAVTIASRHGVPIYVPAPVAAQTTLRQRGAGEDGGGPPIERVADTIPGTALEIRTVHDRRGWREAALYRDADGLLYVPESVGTAAYFRASGERLGVHPMVRAFPPRVALGTVDPDRLVVGHGAGIHEEAATALAAALDGSRRRMPGAYWNALKAILTG